MVSGSWILSTWSRWHWARGGAGDVLPNVYVSNDHLAYRHPRLSSRTQVGREPAQLPPLSHLFIPTSAAPVFAIAAALGATGSQAFTRRLHRLGPRLKQACGGLNKADFSLESMSTINCQLFEGIAGRQGSNDMYCTLSSSLSLETL